MVLGLGLEGQERLSRAKRRNSTSKVLQREEVVEDEEARADYEES